MDQPADIVDILVRIAVFAMFVVGGLVVIMVVISLHDRHPRRDKPRRGRRRDDGSP